ncbi:Probable lipase LipH [Mycobacteroides abscessus subsp. massiliense]|uniref:alpha/beta hydrolase n=1 Tax=Mycobacteroides abscessus TaxID=36809 RepID=UPI0009A59944|nr:alpha/beta hydrolase [Mycobacteroides abscessus]SLH99701.1 Probable lipase LipH [Mycobacteroides abscessus subsp. massiliense]SLI45299.1 Probable lipase LipH [Mycobacteroides abscessus subsp. massiliense]
MTATAGIDPIIVKILEAVPIQLVSPDGPQASRDAYRAIATARPPWIEVANIEDRTIPGPAGEIPARIYSPAEGGVRPVFVLIHGGGWVIGDLDTHDAVARAAAVQADAVVVSVDYRLAPEHPYPAAVEDCWAALQWVHEHAAEIGGDPGRLAVGGDSAGGNLSAVMAQLARDNGIDLAFQVLWYPATTFDTTLPSMVENAEAPVLDFKTVGALSKWYLGDTNPATAGPTLVPARAENFEGLAPAFIGTAQFDPLRDDGAKYAELLRDAGVPVQLHNAPTLIHGYLGYADIVPSATAERDLSLAALKQALHG